MYKRYIKKPLMVKAIKYTPETQQFIIEWLIDSFNGKATIGSNLVDEIMIPTLEGEMKLTLGNYLIQGVEGEFYPCRADIFDQTYVERPEGTIGVMQGVIQNE